MQPKLFTIGTDAAAHADNFNVTHATAGTFNGKSTEAESAIAFIARCTAKLDAKIGASNETKTDQIAYLEKSRRVLGLVSNGLATGMFSAGCPAVAELMAGVKDPAKADLPAWLLRPKPAADAPSAAGKIFDPVTMKLLRPIGATSMPSTPANSISGCSRVNGALNQSTAPVAPRMAPTAPVQSDPIRQFEAAVNAKMKSGMRREKAVSAIAREQPGLLTTFSDAMRAKSKRVQADRVMAGTGLDETNPHELS